MSIFGRKRTPLPSAVVKVESPPTPKNNGGTCILYLPQVLEKLPTLKPIFAGPVDAVIIARLIDTLRNSAIVPPAPWPQVPHRFEHMLTIPSIDAKGASCYVPAFVFYPV